MVLAHAGRNKDAVTAVATPDDNLTGSRACLFDEGIVQRDRKRERYIERDVFMILFSRVSGKLHRIVGARSPTWLAAMKRERPHEEYLLIREEEPSFRGPSAHERTLSFALYALRIHFAG